MVPAVSAEVLVYGIRMAAGADRAAEDKEAEGKAAVNKVAEGRVVEDKAADNKAADRAVGKEEADKEEADKVAVNKAEGMGMNSVEDRAFYIGYSKVRSTGHYTGGCVGCHFHS